VIRVQVSLTPFEISVFRSATGQLIHRDFPGQGILYIPNAEVIAVMKEAAPGASALRVFIRRGPRDSASYPTERFDATHPRWEPYA
jgi:hypothetical protein